VIPEEHRQWHWAEGNKYALECVKALLWLNGGAAIALLTFFGNRGRMLTTASTDAIGSALTWFAAGTIGSVLVFAAAYFTQLQYGNQGFTKIAQAVHHVAYVALLAALGGFHRRNMVCQNGGGGSPDVRSAGPKPRAYSFTASANPRSPPHWPTTRPRCK
jgi:hypothetical protein